MAGGDRSRRTPSEPRLHRRQRPFSGALRRPLSGSRTRADRRTQSVDGGRSRDGAMRRRPKPSCAGFSLNSSVQGVALGAMILKANMVLPGMASTERPTRGKSPKPLFGCCGGSFPSNSRNSLSIGGTEWRTRLRTFERDELAGGLSERDRPLGAHVLLRARDRSSSRPCRFGRGRTPTGPKPQRALLHRAICNRTARRGQYSPDMEANVR